ncbi:MAG TPA: hypothetical protein VFU49_06430, partial [Ktedonobacteraceae bacterium]|nr:hypothetical protein [Ktedonobacteraceae bacterium]
TIAGYSGSDGYLRQVEQLLKSLLEHAQTQVAGRELFDQLARSTYRGKKRLVPIALNSPLFKGNLENVLQQLFPNLEELNDFFISDGSNYLQGHRETMFGVYQKLLPLPDRWQRLSKLLDFSIEENYVFQVWGVAQLMDAEIATVLKKYGASYLSNYQYGPHLAQTVIKQFAFLVERNYSVKELLFALFTITQSTYLEALLSIAQPKLSLDDIRAFFNEYGTLPQYYFFFSEQSPALIWLLRTYLQNSAAWQLEDPASRKFLLSLAQQTKLHKALDANESKWLVIVSFLERPDISSSRLTRLVTALYQSPSDASAVIPELAQAFVKCVGSVSDLNSILLEMYKGSPNVDVYLLFYAIAQHAAETYYQRLNGLIPYAIFALTCSLEGQNSTGRTHFVQVFLDRLLYYITNLSAWKSLHASLCAQQPALPEHALAQWQNYLRGLQLLEQVQSGQPVQPVATTDQEKGSPVPTGGIRGLWRRLLKKDFSTAELKVREALVGRKITRIVNTYQRLTQLEPESYQLRFYQGLSSVEKERLRVACDFSSAYESALKKKGVFDFETERQLDSLRGRIESLDLECTKKQRERLRKAMGYAAKAESQQHLAAQLQSLDPSGLATQKSLPVTQSSVPAQQEQERYSYELPENRSGLHKLFPPLRKKKPGK